MKIDKLIRALELIKKKHGNITVTRYNWESPDMPLKLGIVKVETAKFHMSDAYFLKAALAKGGYAGSTAFNEPYQSEISTRPDKKIVHLI